MSRSSSWSAAIRSSTASSLRAASAVAARSSSSNRCSMRRSAAAPVTASMRRIPEPMLRSPVMMKLPISPDARQWVPPHSSWLKPSTRIVRTLSPYFSSKNASAPAAWASAIDIHSTLDRAVLADDPAHLALDCALLVVRAARGRTGSRTAGSPGARASRPGGPGPRRRCAGPGAAGGCRCGCASCRRAAPGRRPPAPCRRRRRARGATPRWTVSPAVCVPATRWTSSTSNRGASASPPLPKSTRIRPSGPRLAWYPVSPPGNTAMAPMSATWPPLSA